MQEVQKECSVNDS